jgi:prepilin-type N-terminal cleavage/methylation domain-containing protein
MIRNIRNASRPLQKNMGGTPVPPRRAFTLIEILVVLTIIILIALSAMPAIRFIMGSRSIEGTQNVAAAMIGRARSQALADGEQRGVFFFVDPVNDRTTMALVGLGGGDLDQYHGWVMRNPPRNPPNPLPPIDAPGNNPAAFQYFPTGVPNETQSRVIAITNSLYPGDTFSTYLSNNWPRCIIRDYACIGTNTPAAGNRPRLTTGVPGIWATSSNELQMVAGTDFQILPQGVGVQLINGNPAGISSPPGFDRYLRIGCVMFDKAGRFESVPWKIGQTTPIGLAMHLAKDLDLAAANTQPLFSQFGLVLYDRQNFLAATSPNTGAKYVEGDWIFSAGGFFKPGVGPAFQASWPDENDKETWLDNNSMPLLINRYDGTIIKGE